MDNFKFITEESTLPTTVMRWEYATIDLTKIKWEDRNSRSISPDLNKMGEEGWEMVGIMEKYVYFKRLKK